MGALSPLSSSNEPWLVQSDGVVGQPTTFGSRSCGFWPPSAVSPTTIALEGRPAAAVQTGLTLTQAGSGQVGEVLVNEPVEHVVTEQLTQVAGTFHQQLELSAGQGSFCPCGPLGSLAPIALGSQEFTVGTQKVLLSGT